MQRAHGSTSDHTAVPPRNGTPYSYPPTPHDWARIQGKIYELYVVQNQPLRSVRDILKTEYGFRASERMIKARLAKWEYIKNAKREDWGYLAILHDIRRRENKPTVFDIRGHRKTVKDLQRFIRNQNISPEKFLTESLDIYQDKGKQIPDYIRAYTPDPEDILYSPSAETSLSEIRSPSPFATTSTILGARKPKLEHDSISEEFLYYHDPPRSERDNFEHECPYQSYATKPDRISTALNNRSNMSSLQSTSEQANDKSQPFSYEKTRLELEACSTQLLKPIPLKTRIGHNDMRCWTIISYRPSSSSSDDAMDLTEGHACTRCDQPSDIHFPSLDLFETRQEQRNILNDTDVHNLRLPSSTRDEGSWNWVSLCFLACMSLTRGDESVAQKVLDQAASKFEKLLGARDPLLLTAAGLMITVLHLHDQEEISIRILQSAKSVVERVLPESDPIRFMICFLALSAHGEGHLLREAGISSKDLRSVYHELKATYPPRHPYVIATHHQYAWMLKYDGGRMAEAEKHAREVHKESTACFGTMHMQTITSLSVIAGCLAQQPGKEIECIEVYRTMIKDAAQILGVIHPYTLEAQRRLAKKLEHIPAQLNTVVKLHRSILFGRATMLGRNHKFTLGQRTDYEHLLKRLNRWEDRYGNPSGERKEVEDLFTKAPEEAWELVSRVDDNFLGADGPETHLATDTSMQEDEWCRMAIAKSLSRTPSPTSSNEYEAY